MSGNYEGNNIRIIDDEGDFLIDDNGYYYGVYDVDIRVTDKEGLYIDSIFSVKIYDDFADDLSQANAVNLSVSSEVWLPGGVQSLWMDDPIVKLYSKHEEDLLGINLVTNNGKTGHKHKPDLDQGSYELKSRA